MESDYDAVIYFPRNDIAMTFLDYTDKTSHCTHKGYARYFSIITKETAEAKHVAIKTSPPKDGDPTVEVFGTKEHPYINHKNMW